MHITIHRCKKVMKIRIVQNITITDICGCYYRRENNFLRFTDFNQTYDCPEEILDSKPIHSTPVPVYYVADESYTENLPSPVRNSQNDTLRHVYDQPEGNLSRGGSYIVADNHNGMWEFWGDHLIFGRTKGGISRNWEPKRGLRWKLWKDSERGPLKFAWKMKTEGGRGIAKVIKSF